jgi:dihydrofolate reductase
MSTHSKLLYSATMSLDGFIAGVDGDMSWLSEHLTSGPEIDALTANIGALLVGKRTYSGDDPNRGTEAEGAFSGQWHGPVFVLTHEPPAESNDRDVTFFDDLATAVDAAKAAADGEYVNVLGANVAKQALQAGLLDEILVIVAPVLLGDGTRLFEHTGGTNLRLEPVAPERSGLRNLWFRVAAGPGVKTLVPANEATSPDARPPSADRPSGVGSRRSPSRGSPSF